MCGFAEYCSGTKYQQNASLYLQKNTGLSDEELNTMDNEDITLSLFNCPDSRSATLFNYKPSDSDSNSNKSTP